MNRILFSCFLSLLFAGHLEAAPSKDEVKSAMRKAVDYYTGKVAVNGGYVYYSSPDLSRRLGEGVATATEIWVQPPGTPTVGMAFLTAYEATNDPAYLDAAVAAGKALVYGQLKSGGWQNSIDFNPDGPRVQQYRNGKGGGRNNSTLDDDITQSALKFLIRLDRSLNLKDKEISESVEVGLTALLDAQFSIGAFPQVWTGPVTDHPAKEANYPEYDWRTEGRIKEYWDLYTLNDGLAGTVTATLIEAANTYDRADVKDAIRSLGDFLILAQMPEPQQGWAQQYNYDMQPVWARKFEPPAVAGRESEDVMMALLEIAKFTGDKKYLAPIIPGVKYLEGSLMADGRLARYYELKNNKPLYMERKGDVYSLTNDDSNLPNHYGWKNPNRLDLIKDAYRRGVTVEDTPIDRSPEEIVKSLDDEGRWISRYSGELLVGQPKFKEGEEYISSKIFSENLEILSRFLKSN